MEIGGWMDSWFKNGLETVVGLLFALCMVWYWQKNVCVMIIILIHKQASRPLHKPYRLPGLVHCIIHQNEPIFFTNCLSLGDVGPHNDSSRNSNCPWMETFLGWRLGRFQKFKNCSANVLSYLVSYIKQVFKELLGWLGQLGWRRRRWWLERLARRWTQQEEGEDEEGASHPSRRYVVTNVKNLMGE